MQEQYTQQIFKYFKKCDKHLYSIDKEIFTFRARIYKNVVKVALEPAARGGSSSIYDHRSEPITLCLCAHVYLYIRIKENYILSKVM